MTRIGNILSGIIALFLGVMISCTSEHEITFPDNMATLEITTRADGADDDPDNSIESVRVLVFNPGADLVYKFKPNNNSFQISITEGIYDFVFIINENSDGGTLTNILDSYTEGVNQVSDLDDLYFNSSAFANDLAIPATVKYTNVTVSSNKITGNDITANGNRWTVNTKRMGIRVDLFMQTQSEEMATGFKKLSLLNVPNKVFMFNKNNVVGTDDFETAIREFTQNEGDLKGIKSPPDANGIDYTLTPANLPFTKNIDNNIWYWNKRIILPSSMFTDSGDKTNGILLQAMVDENKYDLILSNQEETDYRARPNNRYVVNATLTKWDGLVNFKTSVLEWTDVNQNITFDKQYFLRLSLKNIAIGNKGNTVKIIAETNYDGSYNGGTAGLSVIAKPASWYTVSVSEVEGGDVYKYEISVAISDSETQHWETFQVQAGNMQREIEILQLPQPWLTSDADAKTYEPGGDRQAVYIDTLNEKQWRITDVSDPDGVLIEQNILIGVTGGTGGAFYFYISPSAQLSKKAVITLEDLSGVNPPATIEIKTKPAEDS